MKKIIKASIVILVIGFFSFTLINKSIGGIAGNVIGWVWNGSFGNNSNGCSFSPEECGNSGWGSLSSLNDYAGKVSGTNYGINIPDADGPVTGSLWSSNVGWIDFQPTSGFPTSGCNPVPCPNHGVQRIGNDLIGWARISSITSGFDGWIKSSGMAGDGSSYGLVVDQISQTISGNMWSEDLGWIEVDGTFSSPPCDPVIDPSCAPPPFGLDSICSGTPNPAYLSTGGKVNWKATVISDGVPPYSYSWTFNPAPDSQTGSNDQITGTYSTVGLKSATVEITDNIGNTISSTCKVDMLKTGKVKEDIPLPL